jgi:serine/threonine protein kinase
MMMTSQDEGEGLHVDVSGITTSLSTTPSTHVESRSTTTTSRSARSGHSGSGRSGNGMPTFFDDSHNFEQGLHSAPQSTLSNQSMASRIPDSATSHQMMQLEMSVGAHSYNSLPSFTPQETPLTATTATMSMGTPMMPISRFNSHASMTPMLPGPTHHHRLSHSEPSTATSHYSQASGALGSSTRWANAADATSMDANPLSDIGDGGRRRSTNKHGSPQHTRVKVRAAASHTLNFEDFAVCDPEVVLGHGVTSVVEKIVRNADGVPFAVKLMEVTSRQMKDLVKQEILVHREWKKVMELHRAVAASGDPVAAAAHAAGASDAAFLVEHLGHFATPQGGVGIVMELMARSLGDELPPMTEPVVSAVATMMLRGLRFMHEDLHVMHRDLKPGNVLCDGNGRVKLADFGLSVQLQGLDIVINQYVGSQMFMSPERLRGEDYGYAGDVFSFGVTIAFLILGQHPLADSLGEAFYGAFEARFWGLCGAMRINDGLDVSVAATQLSFRMALAPHCSPCMLDFILRCVNADPTQRPTCSELLRHAFVLTPGSVPSQPHIDPEADDVTRYMLPLHANFPAAAGSDTATVKEWMATL